jgi:tetratricopeptide (TPR) repeat protein
MRPFALFLALWAAAPSLALPSLESLPSLPWSFHLPAAVERWLWNPRERTDQAIEAARKGEADRAAKLADTALRLAEDDPLVRFNDGTAQLAAGHERRAVPLLEQAAREARPELVPAAHYNLGNARLAAGDAAGAVEAYKTALRAEPGNADAKFNLEIAWREKERQRSGLGAPRQGSRGQRRDQDDPSRRPGAGNPSGSERPQDADDPGQSQERQGQGGEQERAGAPSQGPGGNRPLQRYQDQPDMNAREAASLLAAVENLERQQRREEATRRARQVSASGKDW